LGPYGPATSWGPNDTAKAVSFGHAGIARRAGGDPELARVERDMGKEGDRVRGSLGKRASNELAVLALLDELDGVQSQCEVEHDGGKEGNRIEGVWGRVGQRRVGRADVVRRARGDLELAWGRARCGEGGG